MEGDTSSTSLNLLSAQKVLWFHWLRSCEYIQAISIVSNSLPSLNGQTYDADRAAQLQAIADGHRLFDQRIRRIERYLGYTSNQGAARIPAAIEGAKLIRARIERGDGDEAIAYLLEELRKPRSKAGRPVASNHADGFALRALDLHKSNSRFWTYPKIADCFCECKRGRPHSSNSDCVAKLKQAIHRLKTFIAELEDECPIAGG